MSAQHIVVWAALALAPLAQAAEPSAAQDNPCPDFDEINACVTDADCSANASATLCAEQADGVGNVSFRCRAACHGASFDTPNPSACALGETCREGSTANQSTAWICEPTRFRVDLNLLDLAVTHHVLGTQPAAGSDACSLAHNLHRLLDQDGDDDFDIYDLDWAVLAFVERPVCEDLNSDQRCDAPNQDLTPCQTDEQCGAGLFCDAMVGACTRECGRITSRELGAGSLDRECTGFARVCDRARGRCEELENWDELGCAVDGDCPNGTYCFLGQCAAICYGAQDCPEGGWTCSPTNRCRPVAPAAPGADAGLDPARFAIRFLRDELQLSPVRTTDSSALAVMDTITSKQQVGKPGLVFGYRLSIQYGIKQDARCLGRTFVDCEDPTQLGEETEAACQVIQSDCLIDGATESWVLLPHPFGTVSGSGSSRIEIGLDETIADALTPGVYPATVRAIFDNGDSHSIDVLLTKTSPSGRYAGTLVVDGASGVAMNAERPTALDVRLWVGDTVRPWTELMAENFITEEQGSLIDQNEGRVVHGRLNGDASFGFARIGTGAVGSSEIPFIGIYQPDKQRIRIIGFVDIPADFCITENGADCSGVPDAGDGALRVQNPFGRRIVRQIELAGLFNEATGVFNGTYTESIHGLSNAVVTLLGEFVLVQALADDTPIAHEPPLLSAPIGFPALQLSQAMALERLGETIAAECTGFDAAAVNFAGAQAFDCYLDHATREDLATASGLTSEALCDAAGAALIAGAGPAVFPSLATFNEGPIQDAIASLAAGISAPGASPDEQAEAGTAYLNIYDFLAGWLEACDPSDPTPPPVCIESDQARCGLALHQKALAAGWVDQDQVLVSNAGDKATLFCSDLIQLSASACPSDAGTDPQQRALFALQEHNRFWSSVAQSRKFDADRARSDAFLTLFRHQFNPFVEGTALTHKSERLAQSLSSYDALVGQMVGSPGAWVLYGWKAQGFEASGQSWLELLHTVLEDRMDVLTDLVDLRVRVLETLAGPQSFAFVNHMMQHTYLVQVFMTDLQHRWQGAQAAPQGEAARIFSRGQAVLNRLRSGRNALGIADGKTFFETQDPAQSNWMWYRNQIMGPDGASGLLGEASLQIDQAVANLQGALKDLDALEGSLFTKHAALKSTITDICGDPSIVEATAKSVAECQSLVTANPSPSVVASVNACYCDYIFNELVRPDVEAWQDALACRLQASPSGVDCPGAPGTNSLFVDCSTAGQPSGVNLYGGGNLCEAVKTTLTAGDPEINPGAAGGPIPQVPVDMNFPPVCTLDEHVATFQVNGDTRFCLGGQMRALLQEKALLDVQRMHTLQTLGDILSEFIWRAEHFNKVGSIKSALGELRKGIHITNAILGTIEVVADMVEKSTDSIGESVKCSLIAGLAVGTDCPQGIVGGAVTNIGLLIAGIIKIVVVAAQNALNAAEVVEEIKAELGIDAADFVLELKALEAQTGNVLDAYQLATQQSFNLAAKIQALREKLLFAVDRWDGQVEEVADHLIGRESGYVLLADHLVGEGSRTFHQLLAVAHKMVMAFGHHHNLPLDQLTQLTAQVNRAVTLDDVTEIVALLDSLDTGYCGQWGIDCDAQNNVEIVRVSLRDLLFPGLRDIVSGDTGEVLTAGQQFHNKITAPPFLKRRVRGAYTVDQLEIDLYVALQMQEIDPDGPSWQVDPFSCNQRLAAENPEMTGWNEGTVAVDVVGTGLHDDPARAVRYQLLRGPTDFMRGCGLENQQLDFGLDPVLMWPVRKHLVGYPPQSPKADLEEVPIFFTVSSSFNACMHEEDPGVLGGDADCWRFFARDRSLATPELQLIVPLYVDDATTDNTWVLGDGLPEADRPRIEDIVLYFRYRSKPVLEN